MTTIESRIAEQSKILIKGAKGKIGKNGNIHNKDTSDRIDTLIESLIKSTEEENPVPTKYDQN